MRLNLQLLLALASCGYSWAADGSSHGEDFKTDVKVWEGILLILGFGALALLLSLIHWLVRTYIYFDAHRLDTFFDAGGDVTAGLITCSVVSKWAWTASFTWSVYDMVKYGVVGQFWLCIGLVIQPLLFSIVACEIRIKAPGAKTYLQVIYARFGLSAHVTFILFALFVNLLVASMVMYDGTLILGGFLQGVSREVIVVVLAIAVLMIAIVGGVGGSLYVAYVALLMVFAFVITYLVEVFYDPWNRQAEPLGSWKAIYQTVLNYRVDPEVKNDQNSALTFLSTNGLIEGILILLSGLSAMFVNQSYWQTSTCGKPGQVVCGYLLAAFVMFAIPLGFSFSLGTAYQVWSTIGGTHLLTEQPSMAGVIPALVSQRLLPLAGDYIFLLLTVVIVLTTVAGEVLSVTSIVVYDIYQTYVSPFSRSAKGADPSANQEDLAVGSPVSASHDDEFDEYDRRCVIFRHVVVTTSCVILIPLTLLVFAMEVDTLYLFKVLGVIAGCCVLPICFSVTWYRMTSLGVLLGVFSGFVAGLLSWLVYAATFDGGLTSFYVNTSRWEPLMVGSLLSLSVGGVAATVTSLCFGGCDADRMEEDEWERTRAVDSPILPWAVKYAPEFKSMKLKGIPHFFAVRRTFRSAEVSAYLVGVLLASLALLVWPAGMLMAGTWSETVYGGWTLMVVVWVGLATAVIVLYPLIAEIVTVCRQSYYVKKWNTSGTSDVRSLDDDDVSQPERHVATAEVTSIKTVESDYMSTIDSGLDNTSRNERWKTFIHLQ